MCRWSPKEADQHLHRGGLAAAVRTQEAKNLATRYFEADVIDATKSPNLRVSPSA